ncbi:acyl CoA:acetate/3-ketoacid CoA transferase [uncultured Intestinimonas sp.]|uniref:acyl CoA:acetate/3-ketoacid CoA transferase n=1 Tax=uncultured Intestinimonas sp. TaxID=1689265 RepID=UPI0025D474F2|nr:CoA-transferase [uncultured Intestinimonas sp.]
MFQIVTAEEAVQHIHSKDTIAINAFGGALYPDHTVAALERRFLEKHDIEALTFYASGSTGSSGLHKFSDRLCHEGLVEEVIAAYYENVDGLGPLAREEKIAAYNFPQGILSQLLQAAAGGRPGILSEVGLGTFVDPRLGGGKLNKSAQKDLVSLHILDGKEYLFYRTPKLDVCLLRGTTVDPIGNITFEKEALYVDALNMAMATKANGGTVIVQVERRSGQRAHPKEVIIPGILVDLVVLAPNQFQTTSTPYSPYYSGDLFLPEEWARPGGLPAQGAPGPNHRHGQEHNWVARRAAMELRRGALVNLGTGLPSRISIVAAQEGVSGDVVFTVESGVVGGISAVAPDFGAAVNAHVIYGMDDQFNLYDGRGLDLCFLGAAQIDQEGNVNVSKVDGKYIGVGGFINITSKARTVIFCTTFTTGDALRTQWRDNKLDILQEGQIQKFVEKVEQVSFSGVASQRRGQIVKIITERCVFALQGPGLVLTEIAPGTDLKRDILSHMPFQPAISKDLREMDSRIFRGEALCLSRQI